MRPLNLCWIWVNSFIKTRNKHFLPVYKCTLFFLRRGRGLVVFINLQILCPSGIKCNWELRTLKSFVFCNFGWIDFFNFSDISLSNTVVSISSLDFLWLLSVPYTFPCIEILQNLGFNLIYIVQYSYDMFLVNFH